MENENKHDKIEALKRLADRLNYCIAELQLELDELNKALGEDQPKERPSLYKLLTSKKSPCKVPNPIITPTGKRVVFERFDDGTPEGLILPLMVGTYADGTPIYF